MIIPSSPSSLSSSSFSSADQQMTTTSHHHFGNPSKNLETFSITIIEPCSVVLAEYVWQQMSRFSGVSVIKLGAGTSLPGLVAAKVGLDVTLTTESNRPEVLANMKRVSDLNNLNCKVMGLTWGMWDATIFIKLKMRCILCIYWQGFDDLFATVTFLLQNSPGSVFMTTYHNISGHHLIEFLMAKWGLKCTKLLDGFSFMPSYKASGLSGNIQLAEIVLNNEVVICQKLAIHRLSPTIDLRQGPYFRSITGFCCWRAMSEVFEGYERQYCELSANLSKKCTSASLLDGEQKKQKVTEIKAGLDEAESLIRKMDLEARSLQPNVKAVLLAKLREYKSDLNNLKAEVKRIMSTSLNPSARDDLLESGMADALTVSADQRGRLLMSTERLNKSSDRVRESRRTMLETEELGVSILQDLHQQRQSLLHANNTLHGVDDNVGRSKKILTNMSRRMSRNKWIIGGIIAVLVIAIALILYFKLAK
ncbi:Vesicle transport v-SNARE 13 [Camellia lanceoleosa]|uniref:Vesicle transport v-SNARE 13 n=1 Tax=Camellia lanceoleosa TaxID=1840588 RepID=A0ACC0HTK5_9ERIC|nr:Vesicle transport v-SNARE 13 [Camellia lanceoleosa]